MTTNVRLPRWKVVPNSAARVTDEGYLLWLAQERADLIASGALDQVRRDPARCPVDARFRL